VAAMPAHGECVEASRPEAALIKPIDFGTLHSETERALMHESASGRYCCKSRKSNNLENFAKVNF
jgi:hypothetical protein